MDLDIDTMKRFDHLDEATAPDGTVQTTAARALISAGTRHVLSVARRIAS